MHSPVKGNKNKKEKQVVSKGIKKNPSIHAATTTPNATTSLILHATTHIPAHDTNLTPPHDTTPQHVQGYNQGGVLHLKLSLPG